MFDLHGFLVVENAMSAEEVTACNQAIDACWDSEYTDADGIVAKCRRQGHQSNAFHEMLGILEYDKPHCLPFRNLLGHRAMVPYMDELLGKGWRFDHAPFVICGDGTRPVDPSLNNRQQRLDGDGNIGGEVHGHIWDPEYRYRYANGQMRAGQLHAMLERKGFQEVHTPWDSSYPGVNIVRHRNFAEF